MHFLFCIGLNTVLPDGCSGKVTNMALIPHALGLYHITPNQGLMNCCLDYCNQLKNLSLKLQYSNTSLKPAAHGAPRQRFLKHNYSHGIPA